MSSSNLMISAGQWIQIPTTLSISVVHRSGGAVVYAVSDSSPTGFDSSTPIIKSTTIGQNINIGGVGLSIWVSAISQDAVISYTEITDTSSAISNYDTLNKPAINTFTQSMTELYTALGRRYTHKFDLVFSGSETKYYFYEFPSSSGRILAVQERIFRARNGEAELEVLNSSTGYTLTNKDQGTQKANNVVVNDPVLSIYNLNDGAGNVEPTTDGPIFDTDFVTSTGSGSNTAGSFSPQIGARLYSEVGIALKVTNLENSDNRISLEYSWIELDDDYISQN
jgi:hypothetical protein